MPGEGFGTETVVSGERQKEEPKVVSMEHGAVRIYCPRSNIYLTAELHFPTIEDRDNFFAVSPTKAALFKYKGSISFVTPNHLLTNGIVDEENTGDTTQSSVADIAALFGITEKELRTANTLARNTFLKKESP